MGNRPSAPSAGEADELRRRLPELCARAACALGEADVLLLATGAGWSADSGLAVYRDVADVAAYRERGLTYRDICQPHWLEEDPALFYGCWGGCFNDYRNVQEHDGYAILRHWVDSKGLRKTSAAAEIRAEGREHAREAAWNVHEGEGGGEGADGADNSRGRAARDDVAYPGAFFAFTSNVDAHSRRTFEDAEVSAGHQAPCASPYCRALAAKPLPSSDRHALTAKP